MGPHTIQSVARSSALSQKRTHPRTHARMHVRRRTQSGADGHITSQTSTTSGDTSRTLDTNDKQIQTGADVTRSESQSPNTIAIAASVLTDHKKPFVPVMNAFPYPLPHNLTIRRYPDGAAVADRKRICDVRVRPRLFTPNGRSSHVIGPGLISAFRIRFASFRCRMSPRSPNA